jgi:hypothetical protein
VKPARIAYSSTASVKVARQPLRVPQHWGISAELLHRGMAFG